jgi:hypothetical protein
VSAEPSDPAVLPKRDDSESPDTMASAMEDKIEVAERQSESEVFIMKSHVEKLYDEIDSKVKFYRRTTKILRDARKKANDTLQISERLMAELNKLKTFGRIQTVATWRCKPNHERIVLYGTKQGRGTATAR